MRDYFDPPGDILEAADNLRKERRENPSGLRIVLVVGLEWERAEIVKRLEGFGEIVEVRDV